MTKYIGNTGALVDWDAVIKGLEKFTPDSHPGPMTGPTHKAGDPIPRLNEVTDIWTREQYLPVEEGGTVQWDMFFPGEHFDQKVVDDFANMVGMTFVNSAWISRIWPGRFAPIHWDVNDDEETLLLQPDKIRFHCHIAKPAFGHVLVVDDKCLYNQEQGSVWQWPSRRSWHCGTNCGLVPKYLFNIWGS